MPSSQALLSSARGRRPQYFSVASLFSGAGGMDLGAELTGRALTAWAVDSDFWAVRTYEKNFGKHIWCADVQDVQFPEVPVDILLAGPPCQDYSQLWNHDGAKTERGNLFRQVARFLHSMKPKAFILENVPGLLSANHGMAWLLVRHALKTPSAFLYGTSGVRYSLNVSVVNFADLGVPQQRQRLIVMGVRRDLGVSPPPVRLPYAGKHVTVAEALDVDPIPPGAPNHELYPDTIDIVERLKLIPPGGNYQSIPQGHPLQVKGLISHVYRRLDPASPAYTVIAGGGGGTHGYHHREPRRLTNRERARLQSFPDSFIFDGGEGRAAYQRIRRQIGNAVPPQAAQSLVADLIAALDQAGVRGTAHRSIIEARRHVIRTANENGVLEHGAIAN